MNNKTNKNFLDLEGFWKRDQHGEILVGHQTLSSIVNRLGKTPCYLYDRQKISEKVAILKMGLSKDIHLHYAMKANPMPALVCHMAKLVDGIDVASAAELNVALDSGMNEQNISFAGPGKTDEELRRAVAAGVVINIESFREIGVIARESDRLQKKANVAVRVNPPFEVKASGMKMSGGPKQFGVDSEEIPQLINQIDHSGLVFCGFHIFTGSQNLSVPAVIDSQNKSLQKALELATYTNQKPTIFNIGGGLGIPYFKNDSPLETEEIFNNLNRLSTELKSNYKDANLVIELGRYLVGEAGLYVSQVIDKKRSRDHQYLVVDGGLHHHLSASGNFGQVIRKNYPLMVNNDTQAEALVSIVGPLCTPLDLLGDKVTLPEQKIGDLVVILQSGAYGPTASPARFLSHPEAAEALV